MIIAHLSDLHLGFRAYARMKGGMDVRERDVVGAFERAVQEIIRVGPHLIVVSGDVFDRPEPPAGALVALARGLEGLRAALPDTTVLMVAGPRDTPRIDEDPGAMAVLEAFPNVEAATGSARSVFLEELGVHACLVPHRAAVGRRRAVVEPDLRARWNVLVLHAAASGSRGRPFPVDLDEWDYVALGGEHRRRSLGSRAHYAGSLERVSLDPWDEAAEEKGFIVADLESGEVGFKVIPGRAVAALEPIRVRPGEPERLRAKVLEVIGEVPGGIDGKIVRLRLDGVGPRDLLALQGRDLHDLRQRALHLAVEAEPEIRFVSEGLTASDYPAQLRDAVLEELARDGLTGRNVTAAIAALIPSPTSERQAPAACGDLREVSGDVPELGTVHLHFPPGLTAVVGGSGRVRRALAELVVATGRADGSNASRGSALDAFWSVAGAEDLGSAVARAAAAIAEARGLDLVDAAVERAGVEEPPVAAEEGARAQPPPGEGAVRDVPDDPAAQLRVAEGEVRRCRADAAEVGGDLEVATMEWLRERQDAETTLHAYRDRARELRARLKQLEAAGPQAPCPTCGRVLEAHYDEVLATLRDEWESVVQDGRWWKQRREQLELKPEALRNLEQRSVRLQAELDAASERVELLRVRLREAPSGDAPAAPGGAAERKVAGPVARALRRVRTARLTVARDMLLSRASTYVGRITGGRILAVTQDAQAVHLQGDLGPVRPLSEEDLAAGRLAVRLAAATLLAMAGRLHGLVVEEPFDRLDEEARVRTLALIRECLRDVPTVVLFSRGGTADARPEVFDGVLELREEVAGGTHTLRAAPAAFARLAVSMSAGRSRRSHAGERRLPDHEGRAAPFPYRFP